MLNKYDDQVPSARMFVTQTNLGIVIVNRNLKEVSRIRSAYVLNALNIEQGS